MQQRKDVERCFAKYGFVNELEPLPELTDLEGCPEVAVMCSVLDLSVTTESLKVTSVTFFSDLELFFL